MMRWQVLKSTALVLCLVCLFPQCAAAYVGPGAGLSAIGVFLAIVASFIVAIFGFLWYPIKRLLRMVTKQPSDRKEGGTTE